MNIDWISKNETPLCGDCISMVYTKPYFGDVIFITGIFDRVDRDSKGDLSWVFCNKNNGNEFFYKFSRIKGWIPAQELKDALVLDCKNYMGAFTDFFDDAEKMRDFFILSREAFLETYSYLTDEEYDMTCERVAEERKHR